MSEVCLVVGSPRQTHCGVKNYAERLTEALGGVAEVYSSAGWGVGEWRRIRRDLRGFGVVHVQYPSIGFRYSLLPHLLGMGRTGCVTMHEYSSLPFVQRVSLHLFRWTARAIVFTTEGERERFGAVLGGVGAMQVVEAIGSNIPAVARSGDRRAEVISFGQIRPGKGIEEFLELARICVGDAVEFAVMGACVGGNEAYLRGLQARATGNVTWRMEQADGEVAVAMSRAMCAYLPFPDGATYRRGSLMAALANGLPVISTVSGGTSAELARVIFDAPDAVAARGRVLELMADRDGAEGRGEEGRRLSLRFGWAAIADAHRRLYARLEREEDER